MPKEQRVFTRVPFSHPVKWQNGARDGGVATARDVSRGGLSLTLSRFLRPGPVLVLTFDDILYQDQPVELPALTVWCRPLPADPERFNAGFAIVHGETQTLAAISEVFYAGLHDYAINHIG